MGTPVQKDQLCTAAFTGLGHAGEGVGRVDGFTVFVPYVLPEEAAEIRITEVKKNFARGRLHRITQESPHRVTPRCPIFHQCGGCQLQHMDYPHQLAVKRQTVVDNLTRVGHLEGVTVHPTLGMDNPWYYRNKAQIPFSVQNGVVVAGFYAQASHEIINLDVCYIQHPISDRVLRHLRQAVRTLGISVYDERTGKGMLRHCLIKIGRDGEEAMCVLITNGDQLPHAQELIAELREAVPQL
ncbi:MAG: 23S rRNA (uracil(1939)-C(5))-methyltransferase RlmD, partial [Bacillota bacterium]